MKSNMVATWEEGTATLWNLRYKKSADEAWTVVTGLTEAIYDFETADPFSGWTRPESYINSSCGTFSVVYMTDITDASTFFEVAQYAYNDWHDTEWPDADATSH